MAVGRLAWLGLCGALVGCGTLGNVQGSDAASEILTADAGGADEDAGDADTTAPPTDEPAPGDDDKPPPPPTARHVVLVYSNDHDGKDPSLAGMKAVLTAMPGVVMELLLDDQAKATALRMKDLVILGPNTTYCTNSPDPGLKSLAVPIIVSKNCKTTELGLGTMDDTPEYMSNVHITIINANHPLAAGLKLGDVRVNTTKNRLVRGGGVGPDAIKIAVSPEDNFSWTIFAYEKGGRMAGNYVAPAKRVGFFWHRPADATPEGAQLFRAAVEWALAP